MTGCSSTFARAAMKHARRVLSPGRCSARRAVGRDESMMLLSADDPLDASLAQLLSPFGAEGANAANAEAETRGVGAVEGGAAAEAEAEREEEAAAAAAFGSLMRLRLLLMDSAVSISFSFPLLRFRFMSNDRAAAPHGW